MANDVRWFLMSSYGPWMLFRSTNEIYFHLQPKARLCKGLYKRDVIYLLTHSLSSKGVWRCVLTLLSPSMTMTGAKVGGQRCLAGRGLSQFHSTMTLETQTQTYTNYQTTLDCTCKSVFPSLLKYMLRQVKLSVDHMTKSKPWPGPNVGLIRERKIPKTHGISNRMYWSEAKCYLLRLYSFEIFNL